MKDSFLDLVEIATFINVSIASVVVILAFSLLAFTLTYNFRDSVARRFALLLICVVITYTGDVALNRVVSVESANRWLRFQWLGVAMLPVAYYFFSVAVLQTTNYRVDRQGWISIGMLALSTLSAASALFGNQLVDELHFKPPLSYLESGPYFWFFAAYFIIAVLLSLHNIWQARQRCLTENSRKRITYLLLGFMAPGVGVFPFLIGLSRLAENWQSNVLIFVLALIGNVAVAVFLVIMSYTVAYFGIHTPDRVVRYRLIRFFTRGPVVAILVIVALQTLPTVERILGLPRDLILFSIITGIIVVSQLLLSVTKPLTDWIVYREDREETVWLSELDRRLLTTSDLRQFLENNLTALCELLQVKSGFVAAVSGPDLVLEAVIGPDSAKQQVVNAGDWSNLLHQSLQQTPEFLPVQHADFWIWPITTEVSQDKSEPALGILGLEPQLEILQFRSEELEILEHIIERIAQALVDRKLQQEVFVTLQRIIPNIDRIQQLRGVVPYPSETNEEEQAAKLLDPSPIHNPEFNAWVKDALSHYWGGPKLTRSPLTRLQVVHKVLDEAGGDPTKGLRLVLGAAIEKLKPEGKPNLSAPEWLLYNILEMRFIQGHKVREIANRLAMSESDLYRKQRVAIGQVAQMLTEMERDDTHKEIYGKNNQTKVG